MTTSAGSSPALCAQRQPSGAGRWSWSGKRAAVLWGLGAGVIAAVAVPFFAVTTFIGDDHLFLAFARYDPNPFSPFIHDRHGGEYYRPLPMLLWWLLARTSAGASWPFALFAFGLHAAVTLQVRSLIRLVHGDHTTARLAALLFFVSPFTREAAYWYSASTDLLATVFVLASVLAAVRAHAFRAVAFAALAYCSKETAFALPGLVACAVATANRLSSARWRTASARAVWVLAPAVAYLVARTTVLGGLGGVGDPPATFPAKLVQLASGLIHAVTAAEVLPEPLAWSLGLLVWLAIIISGLGRGRRTTLPDRVKASAPRDQDFWTNAPWAWVVLSSLPLLAAPWIVGSRYFYLASVGIVWLAAIVLAPRRAATQAAVLAALVGLGAAQDLSRGSEIRLYLARVSAVRRAVANGVASGHRIFHVDGGVKDIDLIVKEDPTLERAAPDLLVLGDVPASFVALPEQPGQHFRFLLAAPPVPPSGAYHFGTRRIVGLVRRGDEPTLDELMSHAPDVRFIRLRTGPNGRVLYRDVTETLREQL